MVAIPQAEFGGIDFNEFQTTSPDRNRPSTLAHAAGRNI
jgi:hypothetical protein